MSLADAFQHYVTERGERLDAQATDQRREAERQAAIRQEGADALGTILDQLPQPVPADTPDDLLSPEALEAAIREDNTQ